MSGMEKKLTLRGQSFLITGEGGRGGCVGFWKGIKWFSGGAEGGSVVANRRV